MLGQKGAGEDAVWAGMTPHSNPIFTIKLTRSNKDSGGSSPACLQRPAGCSDISLVKPNPETNKHFQNGWSFILAALNPLFRGPIRENVHQSVCVVCLESPFVYCRFHLPDCRAPVAAVNMLFAKCTKEMSRYLMMISQLILQLIITLLHLQ